MNRARNPAGFTLTEVLVAVVIAAISLTGIYAASTQCLRHIWSAREASRAALAADYEIENLCTASWGSIMSLGSSYTMSVSSNPALALLNAASGTVRLASFTGNTNIVQATVILTWTGHGGVRHSNAAAAVVISKNDYLR